MRFTRLTSLQLDRYPSSVFTLEPVCEMREGVSSAERLVRDSHSIVPPPEVRPERAFGQMRAQTAGSPAPFERSDLRTRARGHDDFRRVKCERLDHTRLRAVGLSAGNPPPPVRASRGDRRKSGPSERSDNAGACRAMT